MKQVGNYVIMESAGLIVVTDLYGSIKKICYSMNMAETIVKIFNQLDDENFEKEVLGG